MALVEWIKSNITDNEFAEENIDYEVFVPNDENPLGGRPTMDYGAFVINDEWGGQAMDYWGFDIMSRVIKHRITSYHHHSPRN